MIVGLTRKPAPPTLATAVSGCGHWMGSVDLPYLEIFQAKGRLYAYYRRGSLRRRIHGALGSPEFLAHYQALHAEAEAAVKPVAGLIPGSLRALIAAYRASDEWAQLRPATHKDYEKGMGPLEDYFGHLPVATLPRAFVFKLRDAYATKDGRRTPQRGNRMVAVLSILMSWGVDRGWRPDNQNPCLRPKKLKGGPGWRAWSDAELATFLGSAPDGLRLAGLLAAGTGQRGEDLITMTWAAFDGAAIEVMQRKTGARVWVPCHSALRNALAEVPRLAVTILTRPDGKPWKIDHFRHAVGAAIHAAGLRGVVWHGLRGTATGWLAEAGCTEAEIQAITGHKSSAMAQHYRRGADQKRLAKAAVEKLEHRIAKPKSG